MDSPTVYNSFNLKTKLEDVKSNSTATYDYSDEEYCEVTSTEKRSFPGDDTMEEEQCGASRYVNIPDKKTKGYERCFSTGGIACGETKNPNQTYQELLVKDDTTKPKNRRKPQNGLIEVPNYELFAKEGNDAETEENAPPEVPEYENAAAGFSNISIGRPFPFKTKH